MSRTIFITGGIVSGLGKGITAASLGALIKARGFAVLPQKMDPYLNVDAGTMNPFQHGEVFVTEDGAETDLDLGHYERFLDLNLSRQSNFTTGAIYQAVTEQERNGTYLGKTIQIVPHVTDEIQARITELGRQTKPDFQIVEIGGTVGDIEALPFLEAARQFGNRRRGDTIYLHVVKIDYIYPSDEAKTKPIQQSVALLRSFGIQPDVLVVRAKRLISLAVRQKIALFCGVPEEQIIPALDATSLYDIPLNLERAGLGRIVLKLFDVPAPAPRLDGMREIARRLKVGRGVIRVALVGKYTDLSDAYISVIEAIVHAGIANRIGVEVVPIDSERLRISALRTVDAMIVPGGFGRRGIEGKIRAIRYAREMKLPFLGICLGMQCAIIEFARHVLNLADANSAEFEATSPHPVIVLLPEQKTVRAKGGTMRLGSYPAVFSPSSRLSRLYRWAKTREMDFPPLATIDSLSPIRQVAERHRHRFEVNPRYHAALRRAGMRLAGFSPNRRLVEFIELPQTVHPYFMATQAHPEFTSRPNRAHPLFAGLVRAALECRREQSASVALPLTLAIAPNQSSADSPFSIR